MVHQATRARTKSVQFDSRLLSFNPTDAAPSREGGTFPPTPGTRTSSLPASENKEGFNSIRPYRSMLDVDGAPKLPLTKPLSYEELYPRPTDPLLVHKLLPRKCFGS